MYLYFLLLLGMCKCQKNILTILLRLFYSHYNKNPFSRPYSNLEARLKPVLFYWILKNPLKEKINTMKKQWLLLCYGFVSMCQMCEKAQFIVISNGSATYFKNKSIESHYFFKGPSTFAFFSLKKVKNSFWFFVISLRNGWEHKFYYVLKAANKKINPK